MNEKYYVTYWVGEGCEEFRDAIILGIYDNLKSATETVKKRIAEDHYKQIYYRYDDNGRCEYNVGCGEDWLGGIVGVEIVEQGKTVTLADCDYYSGTKKRYEHMKVLRLMRRKHKRMLRKKEV